MPVMERYEINKWLENHGERLKDLEIAIKPSLLKEKLETINKQMQLPDFWSNTKQAKLISQEAKQIEEKLENMHHLLKRFEDIEMFAEASKEDEELLEVLFSDTDTFESLLKAFEIEILLSNTYDSYDAILEIHPGAGGTESQDWADMLYRLYQRYGQRKRFKMDVLDYQAGEEAGIKSVTIRLRGPYAYGYLKAERGVHRLVRISPFDSNQRRHTSFASIEVMPDIDDTIDIDIKDEDVKIDVYRSGGAGGQSVNTTDSAVRITHLPSGIVVTCQNERSQLKNKETAFKLLKAKLIQEEIKKQEEEVRNMKSDQQSISWGSQIRSYVFHPYQMVKDHRTNHETALIQEVMDGDLDSFINAFLKL
jgi:peptide chain release factor 2